MLQALTSRQEAFFTALQNQILIGDGAMGTLLYDRGIPFTASFEELNLSAPAKVQTIHREYLQAGAQILETNTFGANRIRLEAHALGHKVVEINIAGARLARELCSEQNWVVGSVGPLGKSLAPVGNMSLEETRHCFYEQMAALVEGGVDFILLETFTDLREISQALLAAQELAVVPVFAQMTFTEENKTVMGDKPAEIVKQLKDLGAKMIGANCSSGPQGIFEVMEEIVALPESKDVLLSVMPNAGLPRMIGGRYIYLSSPEYLADHAVRFAHLGINVIGGCCGTTPAHIQSMAQKIAGIKPHRHRGKKSGVQLVEEIPVEPKPESASSFASRLGKEFLVSVEIDPPRGVDANRLLEGAAFLRSKGIDVVNIADSPLARARMSPLVLAHLINEATGMETILHVSCRDRNLLGLQAELMGAHALGIHTVLAVTGDPPKLGDYPTATGVFDIDSIGLVNLISFLNRGVDWVDRKVGMATHFTVGVGINPMALDLEKELERLRQKSAAGAKFIFTQPIFDLKVLENLLRSVQDLEIPIFVGLLPLRNAKHTEFLHHEVPEIFIPLEFRNRMQRAGENGPLEGIKIAQEFLIQAQEMVQGVYIMPPFNRFEMATQVAEVLK